MADLIFSRSINDAPLSVEDIERKAPAAFAETVSSDLSGRYGQVSTAGAIDILADYGFHPVQAAQVKSRKTASRRHAPHMLAFADGSTRGNDHRGELILYNSHDGTSSLKLFAGAYRFICSNGIVAGDGFSAKIRHTHGTVAGFEDMLRGTAGNLPDLMARIEAMQAETLEREEALEFAYNAAALRWEMKPGNVSAIDLAGSYATDTTIRDLLATRRMDDRGLSRWAVFNRVQESIMRGGPRIDSYTKKKPFGSYRKSKAIGNVKAAVDINRKLWDLVEGRTEPAAVKPDIAVGHLDTAPQLIAAE